MAYSNSKTPVILLAFANDKGRSLRQLDEEQRELSRIFEQARKEGKCEPEFLTAATAVDIIQAFQTYRNRIKVFHYGGHSNEDQIFFKGHYDQVKGVKAQSLAAFLALQTGLELIFLNSCLSLAQAEAYYKAGSKAVIATDTEIGDQEARVFAGLFYTGLTTGADISQAYQEAVKGIQIQVEEKYRGIGKKENDRKNSANWQLYPEKPHSWRLPLMAQRLTRIPTLDLGKEFIGREDDLKRLSGLLNDSSRILLVNGLGGIGKTVLAIAYVQTHASKYDHLVWINRGEDLIGSISLNPELADTLNMPLQKEEDLHERFRKILWTLQKTPGQNLLVIDNAQGQVAEKDVQQYLPGPPNWRVLLTSRMDLAGFDQMRLDTLDPDAAKILFSTHFNGTVSQLELQELLREIGYHTLTTELLARLLGKLNNIISVPELTEILREKKLNDPDLQDKIWTRHSGEERGIFLHLMKAFELSHLNEEEKWLLKQFVVLPVEQYLVSTLADFLEKKPLQINKILNSLSSKGWLTRHKSSTFSIHRLIRQVAEYQLQPDLRDIETLLEYMIQKMTVEVYTNRLKTALPWINYAIEMESYFATKQDEKIAILQDEIASTYRDLGQYKQALSYHQKAQTIKELVLEVNDLSLATSYNNIAITYRLLGQYEQALSYHKKALAIKELVLEANDLSLATSYNNIAEVYRALGQYKQALSYHQKDIAIKEPVLEVNDSSLATSYHNIASTYHALGQYEQALSYHKKALAIKESVLEVNHPLLATSYHNIAGLYRDFGQYEQALNYHQKALVILESVHEANHPSLANIYNDIGLTYHALGRYEQALSYHQKAQTIWKLVLGLNHPSLAASYVNVALTYHALRQYKQALSYHQKALVILESVLTFNHPTLANVYNNIASTYRALGQYEQALSYHQKALVIRESVLGANHPLLANAYNNTAGTYRVLGQYEQALSYHKKALVIRESVLGVNHPSLAFSYRDIALTYRALEQRDKANEYETKAATIRKQKKR